MSYAPRVATAAQSSHTAVEFLFADRGARWPPRLHPCLFVCRVICRRAVPAAQLSSSRIVLRALRPRRAARVWFKKKTQPLGRHRDQFDPDLLTSAGGRAPMAGVFPDGTPFRMPTTNPLPQADRIGQTSSIRFLPGGVPSRFGRARWSRVGADERCARGAGTQGATTLGQSPIGAC